MGRYPRADAPEPMSDNLQPLAQSIERRLPGLTERWMAELHGRSWSLRALVRGRPGGGDGAQDAHRSGRARNVPQILAHHAEHFLASLAVALRGAERLEVGAPAFREPVQVLSFTAGWMAGCGLGIGDAVALVDALRVVLGPHLEGFYQALLVVVCEAFMAAVDQKAQVRYRDAMERCQLVVPLRDNLPCLFLVGDPDRRAMDDAVGRLMMLALMRGADRVVVDITGLADPSALLPELVPLLQDYHTVAHCNVLLTGAAPEHRAVLDPLTRRGISTGGTVAALLTSK